MNTYIKLEVSWMWKEFQDEVVHQKTLTKKAPGFFGSWSELLIFQTYFSKSKTQTDDRFCRYCDSSVESLRLSALTLTGRKTSPVDNRPSAD